MTLEGPDPLEHATPGDIVLFRHPVGIARIIPIVLRSPYYHVAIYAGGVDVIEAIPSGVVRCAASARGRDRNYVVIAAPNNVGDGVVAWARSKIGDGYDPRDMMGLLLDRIFARFHINVVTGDRYTCGEFVAAAFENAGLRLFPDIDTDDVMPSDFARLLPQTRQS